LAGIKSYETESKQLPYITNHSHMPIGRVHPRHW